MVYFIAQERLKVHHAGGKAPNDIYTLCERRGWAELFYPNVENCGKSKLRRIKRGFLVLCFWLSAMNKLKPGDVVFYQHPTRYGSKIAYRYISRLKNKNVKFVMLIHDLDSLRYHLLYKDDSKTNVYFEDDTFIKLFDAIICHNEHMKEHLILQGVPERKLVCLELFDYLLPSPATPSTEEKSLVIAGNLNEKKCGYIYELAKQGLDCTINLYGMNFNEALNHNNKLVFQGSFPPDELPFVIKGKFGIVWDGNSIDTCDGATGKYLRYNNPHKLSLFMAAGLPVITWKQAANADFVIKHGVGLAVDSLREIPDLLTRIDEEQYAQMRANVMTIQQMVIKGEFFTRAIDTAFTLLNQE